MIRISPESSRPLPAQNAIDRWYVRSHDGPVTHYLPLDFSAVPDGVEVLCVPDAGGSYGAAWSEGVTVDDDTAILRSAPVGAGIRAFWASIPGVWVHPGMPLHLCPGRPAARVGWVAGNARTGDHSGDAVFVAYPADGVR